MSNTILTPSVIAKEALLLLYSNMVMGRLVHKGYAQEFERTHNGYKVGDTITIRKPAVFESKVWNGSTIDVQDIKEGSTDIKLDTVLDISFSVSSLEWKLELSEFSERVLKPVMLAHANEIDRRLAGLYWGVPGFQAVSSTPVTGDLLAARAVLNVNKVPMDSRFGVLSAETEPKYAGLDAFLHADKRGDTVVQKEGAFMGRTFGFEWYMDQNIATHVKGSVTNSVTVARGTSDTTKLKLTETGKTVKKGDILKVTSDEIVAALGAGATINYVMLEDKNINTAAEVSVYPPVAYDMTSASAVVLATNGKNNLMFHRNAFAMVSVPLEKPKGAAQSEVVSGWGLSARMTCDYNMQTKTDVISIDLLLGMKTLMPELAVRLVG